MAASGSSVDAGGCSMVAGTTSRTKPSSAIFMMGVMMGGGAHSTPVCTSRERRAVVRYCTYRAGRSTSTKGYNKGLLSLRGVDIK